MTTTTEQNVTINDMTTYCDSPAEDLSNEVIKLRLTNRASSMADALEDEGKSDHGVFNGAFEIGLCVILEARYHFETNGSGPGQIADFARKVGEMLADFNDEFRERLALAIDFDARDAAIDDRAEAEYAKQLGAFTE